MTKLDIKSAIIGALSIIIILLLTGATQQNSNQGDITVTSLRVVDDEGNILGALMPYKDGVVFGLLNNQGDEVVNIAARDDGALMSFYTPEGRIATSLGGWDGGNGLRINDEHGSEAPPFFRT